MKQSPKWPDILIGVAIAAFIGVMLTMTQWEHNNE